VNRGDTLPVVLPSLPDGSPVHLRAGRGPLILALIHDAACDVCHDFLRTLDAHEAALSIWGARLFAVVRGPVEATSFPRTRSPARVVLADPGRRLDIDAAALVIADEWGEVWHVAESGASHDLPGPDEIEEWARFIAIQCPECEAPEGVWRAL